MTQTTTAPLALSDDAQELLFRSARTAKHVHRRAGQRRAGTGDLRPDQVGADRR